MHEFAKATFAPACLIVLMEKGKIRKRKLAVLKDPDELFPGNVLERFFGLAELDARDPAFVIHCGRAFGPCEVAVSLFGPFAIYIMVNRRFRLRHGIPR